MKVAKFGGSSVKEASTMVRCSSILKERKDVKVSVISATYNSTNQLEDMATLALKGESKLKDDLVEKFYERHLSISTALNLRIKPQIQDLINELSSSLLQVQKNKELSKKMMDKIYPIGERISSLIFSEHLEEVLLEPVRLVEAKDFILTDDTFGRANVLLDKLQERVDEFLYPLIARGNHIVTQGFIGSTLQGDWTTLGREGSDYTGSLLAWALKASELQIWTDVPGIFSADPKIDKMAQKIDELSYDEAHHMAINGAKVLFAETMRPAQKLNIPIFVGSTFEPEKGGTYVR